MNTENKAFIVLGCILLAMAGGLAAFGFHGPAEILTPEKRESWAWAVDLQYFHAGGLIVVGIMGHLLGRSWFVRGAGLLMLAGMLIFSGLVYLNTFGLLTSLSGIVPNGGGMLMSSWVVLAIGVIFSPRQSS